MERILTRISSGPRDLAFGGKVAVLLSFRFFSRPPAVWENCQAFIDWGIDEDILFCLCLSGMRGNKGLRLLWKVLK